MDIFDNNNVYSNSKSKYKIYIKKTILLDNELEEIKLKQSNWNINIIFNVKNSFMKYVKIGQYVICELPKFNWEKIVDMCINNIFLFTGQKEWLILKDYNIYNIEYKDINYRVWFCKIVDFSIIYDIFLKIIPRCENSIEQNLKEDSSLLDVQCPPDGNVLPIRLIESEVNISLDSLVDSLECLDPYSLKSETDNFIDLDKLEIIKNGSESLKNIKKCRIINARCKKSMYLLDNIHRKYITNLKIKENTNNDIIAIKSVAGSGKTTSLLRISSNNKDKKILYLAFNKSLVEEIKTKIKNQNIDNLYPHTFDSLMRKCFINIIGEYLLVNLKPFNLHEYIPWFKNKRFNLKKSFIAKLDKFCNQTEFNDINKFSLNFYNKKDNLLEKLWEKVLLNELQTFNTIRKLNQNNHYCKDYIDNNYDAIVIDEAQDFDGVMLNILLNDTKIPKIFVGDIKQAIYKWRGCINSFDRLPLNTLNIEFYSTFRIGEPACNIICDKISNLYMFSKSNNETILEYNIIPKESYTYLFRTWKVLLETAQITKDIWIYNYNKQKVMMENLHDKLKKFKLSKEELAEFSDDLPLFLCKLTKEELTDLLDYIEGNLVEEKKAMCKMYTIHSFKGLEDNIVKIANDIDKEKEENLYYVAITRAKKNIIIDL
jgi:F-box protein, helicase, 18